MLSHIDQTPQARGAATVLRRPDGWHAAPISARYDTVMRKVVPEYGCRIAKARAADTAAVAILLEESAVRREPGGNLLGIPRDDLFRHLAKGQRVDREIDCQTAGSGKGRMRHKYKILPRHCRARLIDRD